MLDDYDSLGEIRILDKSLGCNTDRGLANKRLQIDDLHILWLV